MRYIPHTSKDVLCMMEALGIKDVGELFESIPKDVRLDRPLDLPAALSESELDAHFTALSSKNADPAEWTSFLGGGAYRHYIPAAVPALALRSEFATAYTPYQPEVSQGTLQAIFEFQTLICQLTGMEIANASMYDGAQSFAEAALMLLRIARKRKNILVARSAHPEYRATLDTYIAKLDCEAVEIPFDTETGRLDGNALENELSEDVAGLLTQSPNFFGVVEDLPSISEACGKSGALLGVTVAEPLSMAIIDPPGTFGATIVCGETQSFGIPISFGGPGAGFLAGRMDDVRNLPGRLCGQTIDSHGETGYCLTLAAREQHIRREKATSNICTNQALMALMATVYLSLMGKTGLRKLARINLSRTEYAKKSLANGASIKFAGPTFNEFVLEVGDAEKLLTRLNENNILGGIHLGRWYTELENCLLISITELNSKEDIDRLVSLIKP